MTESIKDDAGLSHTDFVARHHELQQGFKELYRAVPGAMSGFTAMHKGGVADGALSRGMKELIALE